MDISVSILCVVVPAATYDTIKLPKWLQTPVSSTALLVENQINVIRT